MADFSALKTAIQTYIKQNGNEEITGEILQEILLSMVTTLGDTAINNLVTALTDEVAARQNADGTLQQNITNEATARGNADTALGGRIDDEAEARAAADTALQGLIDGITDNIENGYVYAGIATPSSTPTNGKVFYLALTSGTYINFGNIAVTQGINILKYNGSAWSLDAFIGIDDTPTPNSPKLVKSGGTFESVMTNGSAFDISAHFASGGTLATYADLNAALAALNTLSASYKRGGMSIKFVQSSDNKYVQFRCMSQSFTTDVTKWQGIDDEPTAGSDNLVESGGVVKYADKNIFNKIGLEILPSQFLYGKVALWGGDNIGKLSDSASYNCIVIPVTGIINWENYNSAMFSDTPTTTMLYSGYPSHETYVRGGNWRDVIGQVLSSNIKYVVFNTSASYTQQDYENAGFYIYTEPIFALKDDVTSISQNLLDITEKYTNEISNDCVPIQILKGKAIQKLGYLINFSQTNLYVYDVRSIRNTNNLYKVSYDDWNILTYVAVKSISDIPTDSAHASTASFIKFEQSGGNDHSIHSIFRNVPTGANYIVVSLKTTETPLSVFKTKINVDCYGDSLTDAGAWVGRLQELLGNKFNVRNFGISGQGAASITYRQGGTPIYIGTAFTIPASRDYVEVNVVNYPGGTAISNLECSNQHANINPVYINRVKGELKYESSKWYFRRELAGAQISVPSGKIIYTHGLQDIGDISIFWMGTNDAINSYGAWVRSLISSCTEKVFNGKFLVLGLHAPRTDGSLNVTIQDIQSYNAELKTTFGKKFVDELDYMCNYGMAGLGLTPTATDEEYMDEGKVPPSLLDSAELHYTAEASAFLGEYIYAAFVENGYLGNIK